MKLLPILSLIFLLPACISTPTEARSPGLHTVPVGSIVKLKQPLLIPAQRVRAGVQYGEATLSVYSSEPYCEFEVNTISDKEATLPAGDYRITRVRRYEDPFYTRQLEHSNQVASTSEAIAWGISAMSPDSHWTYTTVFSLESNVYADIRQLVCGNTFPSGFEARHITIREFEELAGDIMTIQIADR